MAEEILEPSLGFYNNIDDIVTSNIFDIDLSGAEKFGNRFVEVTPLTPERQPPRERDECALGSIVS